MAAALRLAASFDDFWLDEIWSWIMATQAKSFLQIALGMRHDNNHVLNTWIIYLFPPETPWIAYRLPAVAAGVGTVILAGLCGFRRSTCEGLTALGLTGGSFVLIQYSSEARGYAYLLLFVMLCVWLAERISSSSRILDQWLFALSACGGFLAHLSFATAFFGLLAWTVTTVSDRHPSWTERIRIWLRMYGLPILIALVLIVGNGSAFAIGGGNQLRLTDVVVQAGSVTIGGPNLGASTIDYSQRLPGGGYREDPNIVAILAFVACVTASITATVVLYRGGQTIWQFWVSTASCLALILLFLTPDIVYVRYFLIEVFGAIVLISYLLSRLWNKDRRGKIIYVCLMAAMLVGNAIHITQLLQYGRGGYGAAIAFMLENSEQIPVTIGSDHDFRNHSVLDYHYNRLSDAKPIRYFEQHEWPVGGVDWFIRHSFEQPPKLRQEIQDPMGNRYKLVRVFPYSGLSGWNWLLYRQIRKD